MRTLLPDERRQLAGRLPVDEHPVAHQVPAFGLHALVVEAGGGQAAGLRAIADQVDDARAEAELAGVGRLEEARAGHVRFPAERAIELGRVADRFVDGEEQLRRIDHDVVACRATTGFAFSFSTTSWPAFSASRSHG